MFRFIWIVYIATLFGCVNHELPEPKQVNQPPVKPRDCSGTDISYKKEVKSIIETRCAKSSCHNSSATRVDLSLYQNLLTYKIQIISRVETGSMPYDESLPEDLKIKLLCWLDSGAPNN